MVTRTEQRAGATIVSLAGDLWEDAELLDHLRQALDRGNVVVELSGVRIINSACLSALVRATSQANSQRRSLLLAQPSPFVEGVLGTTRLDRFFNVFDNVDAAVAESANGP